MNLFEMLIRKSLGLNTIDSLELIKARNSRRIIYIHSEKSTKKTFTSSKQLHEETEQITKQVLK